MFHVVARWQPPMCVFVQCALLTDGECAHRSSICVPVNSLHGLICPFVFVYIVLSYGWSCCRALYFPCVVGCNGIPVNVEDNPVSWWLESNLIPLCMSCVGESVRFVIEVRFPFCFWISEILVPFDMLDTNIGVLYE